MEGWQQLNSCNRLPKDPTLAIDNSTSILVCFGLVHQACSLFDSREIINALYQLQSNS